MNIDIIVQQAVEDLTSVPSSKHLHRWCMLTLQTVDDSASGILTIRIVDLFESQQLNLQYRNKNKPTNVLAFPYHTEGLIGDLVICAPLVIKEAMQQGIAIEAHWAHLAVHGSLHCMGYDHINQADREIMEALEIQILSRLGFANPYEEEIV